MLQGDWFPYFQRKAIQGVKLFADRSEALGGGKPPVPGGVQAGIDWARGDDMEGICASNGVVGFWA